MKSQDKSCKHSWKRKNNAFTGIRTNGKKVHVFEAHSVTTKPSRLNDWVGVKEQYNRTYYFVFKNELPMLLLWTNPINVCKQNIILGGQYRAFDDFLFGSSLRVHRQSLVFIVKSQRKKSMRSSSPLFQNSPFF